MKRHGHDIAIIGSGAGGGTVAQELPSLCRDGVRIAVLEKGANAVRNPGPGARSCFYKARRPLECLPSRRQSRSGEPSK